MANTWKLIAIVFIIITLLETALIIWSISTYYDDLEKSNICYYEICINNTDAYYESGVCYCYDYNLLGELDIVKTKLIK